MEGRWPGDCNEDGAGDGDERMNSEGRFRV